ncbi:MAG: glycosyltransferase [Bacteroidota bacterium]|jgi:glycosyltransferase involved in cell wall biosynthesis
MSAPGSYTRTVLVIAYYFPPLGLSGVQRTLKFVKYLPQFGWQPIVLTVTPTGYYAQDYTLLDELHHLHIDIVRVGSLDPNRLFRKKGVVKMPSEPWRKVLTFLSDTLFVPDNKIGWKRKALETVVKMSEEKPIDAIFATAPPYTDFLIGAELKKRLGKPLVLDYRDAWHENPFKYYPTPLHKLWNYKLEKAVLHSSSKIITTNRRVKELLLRRFKFLSYDDVIILPQGYDPQDFSDSKSPAVARTHKMRITHAGVFYGDRSPRYFFEALRKVFTDYPELKGRIEACFVGNFHDKFLKMITSMGLEGDVTTTGYLDHQHCVQYLVSSDVLWVMLNNDSQSPGKVYEYMGARKPVLACVPDGFIRDTLRETDASTITDPTDVAGIASGILNMYRLFEQNRLPKPREDVVQKYDRVKLTGELAKILRFLVD